MALLTDLTIHPTFDQAKKKLTKFGETKLENWTLEKTISRKDPMNELLIVSKRQFFLSFEHL